MDGKMGGTYKSLKEDFVSNLSGGTIGEINIVTSVAAATVLLWAILQSRHGFFTARSPVTNAIDFLLNVCGILLATTLYSPNPPAFLAILVLASSVYLFVPATSAATQPGARAAGGKNTVDFATQLPILPLRPFLTYYRGTMMVVTCASILAVDFPIFPRRFAKVETWGTSLMDLGVGSFVFSAGVVATKATLKDRYAGRTRSLPKRLGAAVRATMPLLVLGLSRILSVKQLDYAEHVSEYGTHWNFFFTMAVVPLAMAVLQPWIEALPGPRYALAGLALSFAHQVALSSTRLQAWALTAPRTNFVAANREGLTSTIGYLAIWLLGMSAGTIVLPRTPDSSQLVTTILRRSPTTPSPSPAGATRTRLVATLILSSMFYSAILVSFSMPRFLSINISRRLANMPYVMWIAAFNCAQLAAFCLVESLCFPAVHRARTTSQEQDAATFATSAVLEAFNSAGLLLFLAANLATGAVNMALDTLHMHDLPALAVLLAYMAGLTLLALNLKGFKLKF